MKVNYSFIFFWIFPLFIDAQPFLIGNKEILAENLTQELFDIKGKWKIIHYDFYTEDQVRKERINLIYEDSEYYALLNDKSRIYLGDYIEFFDSIYQPYCSYRLGDLIPNLVYKHGTEKFYTKDMAWDQESETYELLKVDLYCKDSSFESGTFYVINRDHIFFIQDGTETYFERERDPLKHSSTWPIDNEGFFYEKFYGEFYGEVDIRIPDDIKEINISIEVEHGIQPEEFFEYYSVNYLSEDNCDIISGYIELLTRPDLPTIINLDTLPSRLLRIDAFPINRYDSFDYKYWIKWKLIN